MGKFSREWEDQILNSILFSFQNYNLRDIKEINSEKQELEFTIAVFTLCSCFIDQLSGFRYATDRVKYRFKKFVKEYLPMYDAEELNDDLRNRLVHNYSVGSNYLLSRHEPPEFVEQTKFKVLVLDRFIDDIENAFAKYKEDLKKDPQIRSNALEWFGKYLIIGSSNHNVTASKQALL